MALNPESCTLPEMCEAFDGSEKLLNNLRERLEGWLKLQPHLPQETLDHFILGTKMSLEQAKRKLDMFYTMKRLAPEVLANRDPRGSGLTCVNTMTRIVYLPKLTPNKCRVCICKLILNDFSRFNGSDVLKYTLMIDELLSITSRNLGNIVYIFDQTMMSLSLLAEYPPTLLKKTEVAIRGALARSIKGIHFVNPIPLTNTLLTLLKKVLKPKLTARVCILSVFMQIHVHSKGSYDFLHHHVPKSILPKDYGGDERSMAELAELWYLKVDEYRDWFLEQDKIVVDERLRSGPAVNTDELFGFSGSLRKLDAD